MKILLITTIIFCLFSCSEDKKGEVKPTKPEDVKVTPQKPAVKVQVGWKIPIEPSGGYYEYADVNDSLANRIIAALDGAGETMDPLPELKQPRLKVGDKEYRFYPHTLIDEKAKKAYKVENVYKDLYRVWLTHISKVDK